MGLIESKQGSMTGADRHRGVLVEGSAKGMAQTIEVGAHRLVSDEPIAAGGTDTGPDPYALLLAALGSCTSITLSLYARRKEWKLDGVRVRLRHSKTHAEDCAECETTGAMLDRIDREIELDGDLDEQQRARLLDIANKCPVHRTLTSKIQIQTRLIEPESAH